MSLVCTAAVNLRPYTRNPFTNPEPRARGRPPLSLTMSPVGAAYRKAVQHRWCGRGRHAPFSVFPNTTGTFSCSGSTGSRGKNPRDIFLHTCTVSARHVLRQHQRARARARGAPAPASPAQTRGRHSLVSPCCCQCLPLYPPRWVQPAPGSGPGAAAMTRSVHPCNNKSPRLLAAPPPARTSAVA